MRVVSRTSKAERKSKPFRNALLVVFSILSKLGSFFFPTLALDLIRFDHVLYILIQSSFILALLADSAKATDTTARRPQWASWIAISVVLLLDSILIAWLVVG